MSAYRIGWKRTLSARRLARLLLTLEPYPHAAKGVTAEDEAKWLAGFLLPENIIPRAKSMTVILTWQSWVGA